MEDYIKKNREVRHMSRDLSRRSKSVDSSSYGVIPLFEEFIHYTEAGPVTFMFMNKKTPFCIFSLTLLDDYILCTGITTASGTYSFDLVTKQEFVGKCYRAVSTNDSPRCPAFDSVVKYKFTLDSEQGLIASKDLYHVYSKRFGNQEADLFPVYIKCKTPITTFAFMDLVPKIYDIIKDK